MNKRDLILVGVGLLIGYVVFKDRSRKTTLKEDIKFPDTSNQTLPPASTNTNAEAGTTQIQEPEVVETLDTPQVVICKEKWIKFAETQKFGSQEQMQNTYDNFMTSCVGQGLK